MKRFIFPLVAVLVLTACGLDDEQKKRCEGRWQVLSYYEVNNSQSTRLDSETLCVLSVADMRPPCEGNLKTIEYISRSGSYSTRNVCIMAASPSGNLNQ
jgi:hypothetical protein